MNISLNWLKNYVDIPSELSAEELAEKITMSIVEVESFYRQADNLENIIIGQIKKINKHPNADKLKVCDVSAGKKGSFKIVCGGNNLRENMFIALALVGAKIKWHGEGDLIVLEKAKIRGVESEGMICAAEEIGLPSKYIIEGGIADLDLDKSQIGQDIVSALNLNDIIFEIDNKSLTNRPDLWGHYGLARDLAALLNVRFKSLIFSSKFKIKKKHKLEVHIKNQDACPRYMGVIMDNIKVGPSPEWLASSLEKVGIRSINNIVDITNFVMLELGQPMHAFDIREIKDEKIIVQKASTFTSSSAKATEDKKASADRQTGKKFISLDEEERKLNQDDLLICDSQRAVALAGIMGGLNSEIKDDTKSILIEAANFEPVGIRKTSAHLGLRTDSSTRFEKGLDPNLVKEAMMRAIELIRQLNVNSFVASRIVDKDFSKQEKIVIDLNFDFINKKIGEELPPKTIIDILKKLNFGIKEKKDRLEVSVPSYRSTGDINIPEDLIEEISRIYGYDNIKIQAPKIKLSANYEDKILGLEKKLKNFISLALGYNEVYNYSMVSEEDIQKVFGQPDDYIAIANAVSKNLKYLRNDLFLNLLKNVQDNLRYFSNFKLFEIGRVFQKKEGDFKSKKDVEQFLPEQNKTLDLIWVGDDNKFLKFKGDFNLILDKLNLNYHVNLAEQKLIKKEFCLEYVCDNQPIGFLGEVKKNILQNFDIEKKVFYARLNLDIILKYIKPSKKYQEISKYPSMVQDISMIVNYSAKWQDIEEKINALSPLIIDVDLFDIYEGQNIEKNKRSLAFHITFHNFQKTLVSAEVEKIMQEVKEILVKDFHAEIRD